MSTITVRKSKNKIEVAADSQFNTSGDASYTEHIQAEKIWKIKNGIAGAVGMVQNIQAWKRFTTRSLDFDGKDIWQYFQNYRQFLAENNIKEYEDDSNYLLVFAGKIYWLSDQSCLQVAKDYLA